ncbi:hypothetical protein EV121DRAFT_254037 [Schizophyllum commune]
MYLHEQLKLVGTEPVPLERVSTYRGLSSRSIRVSPIDLPCEAFADSLRRHSSSTCVTASASSPFAPRARNRRFVGLVSRHVQLLIAVAVHRAPRCCVQPGA